MDFALEDEQRMLQDTARDFVSKVCPPRQAKEWDEAGVWPPELFAGMAEMGWFGLPLPAEDSCLDRNCRMSPSAMQ